MIKAITSKNNERVKFACSLKESKNRKIHQMFLAETFKSLEMAIKNNMVVEIFTTEYVDAPSEDVVDNLPEYDIPASDPYENYDKEVSLSDNDLPF